MSSDLKVLALAPAEFVSRVVPALLEREAENGLPIGIARRLASEPRDGDIALLLSVELAGAVVGAAVWTPPHDVVTTRLVSGAAALIAEQCRRFGQEVTGASGPEGSGLELAEQLAQYTGAAVRVRVRQRVYELLELNEVPRVTGAMRRATPADVPLVADWYSQFLREVDIGHSVNPEEWASASFASGSAFLWEDASAVRSLACLSRESPNGRAIGPVYTPPSARRQGYATSLVSELAGAVLAGGKRFAVLFTDAANPTSNHIYESIGFRFVCPYDAYRIIRGDSKSGSISL